MAGKNIFLHISFDLMVSERYSFMLFQAGLTVRKLHNLSGESMEYLVVTQFEFEPQRQKVTE